MKIFTFLLPASLACYPAAAKQNNPVKSYLDYVYKAEHDIAQGNYAGASLYYDSAFATGFHPWAADIYNYSLCAIAQKDLKQTLRLSKMLVLKGADLVFFQKEIYRPFARSAEYKELEKQYPKLKQERSKHIDTKLVQQLKNYVAVDQSLHRQLPNPSNEFQRRVHNQDDSLARVLNTLLQKHQYLSEDILGGRFEDTILNAEPIWGIIALHQFEGEGTILFKTVNNAIHYGKLRPDIGLEWIQHGNFTKVVYTSNYFILNDTLREWEIKKAGLTNPSIFLLSEQATKKEEELQDYYHIDDPGNIIDRLYFNYSRLSKRTAAYTNGFLISPKPSIVNGPDQLKDQFRKTSVVVHRTNK